MPATLYANFLKNALTGDIDLTSDTLKMTLLGSGYTPDFNTNDFWSDIDANEITGTGYTPGGVTLSGVTLTLTAADSWGVTWAASTGYAYGQVVRPDTGNGLLYRCVVAGTSGSSEPSFPTVVGETVTDDGVTWACMGADILIFSSDTVEWSGATFTAYYAVIRDAQSGTASTEPLIVAEVFSAPQSPDDQPYEVIPNPILGWFYFSPPS